MKKLHRPNGRKQKERFFFFALRGGRSYPGGLGQRFGQDNAGHKRIAREMTREHWIIAIEDGRAFGRDTGIARNQFTYENERRPVRQAKISDQ